MSHAQRPPKNMKIEYNKNCALLAMLPNFPEVWRKDHPSFMNREVRKSVFARLAEGTGMTVNEIRRRLKNLKDKMRDTCRKLPKTKSGLPAFQEGKKTVKWTYYKMMLFMKDEFMDLREPTDISFAEGEQTIRNDDEIEASMEGEEERIFELDDIKIEGHDASMDKTTQESSLTKKSELVNELLDLEKEKLIMLKEILGTRAEDDEWSTFVSSLTFDLRKITNPYLIVEIKDKITSLVNATVLEQFRIDSTQGVGANAEGTASTSTSKDVVDDEII